MKRWPKDEFEARAAQGFVDISPRTYSLRLSGERFTCPTCKSTLHLPFAHGLQLIERVCPSCSKSISLGSRLDPCVIYQQTRLAFSFILKLHIYLRGSGEFSIFKGHTNVFILAHSQKSTLLAVPGLKCTTVFYLRLCAGSEPLA